MKCTVDGCDSKGVEVYECAECDEPVCEVHLLWESTEDGCIKCKPDLWQERVEAHDNLVKLHKVKEVVNEER